MSNATQAILDAAMKLSDAERADLITQLTESLPAHDSEFWDKDFAAELDRRADEIERGGVQTVSWSVLREQE